MRLARPFRFRLKLIALAPLLSLPCTLIFPHLPALLIDREQCSTVSSSRAAEQVSSGTFGREPGANNEPALWKGIAAIRRRKAPTPEAWRGVITRQPLGATWSGTLPCRDWCALGGSSAGPEQRAMVFWPGPPAISSQRPGRDGLAGSRKEVVSLPGRSSSGRSPAASCLTPRGSDRARPGHAPRDRAGEPAHAGRAPRVDRSPTRWVRRARARPDRKHGPG